MSVSKIKHEFRTIIDIGSQKVSESKVKKILRETTILSWESTSHKLIHIDNQIDIGIYRIVLLIDNHKSLSSVKLKDYRSLKIRVYELFADGMREIDLRKDYRFKGYSWIRKNELNNFNMTDLVDAILTCHKLDALKVFN